MIQQMRYHARELYSRTKDDAKSDNYGWRSFVISGDRCQFYFLVKQSASDRRLWNSAVFHARATRVNFALGLSWWNVRSFIDIKKKGNAAIDAKFKTVFRRFISGRNFPISNRFSPRVSTKLVAPRSTVEFHHRPPAILRNGAASSMPRELPSAESRSISRRGGMSGVPRQQIVLTEKEIVFPIRLVCSPATAGERQAASIIKRLPESASKFGWHWTRFRKWQRK